ncbi:MAG: hypothetical protein WBO55_09000 [Rhizobiaceae bacterium]
MRSLKILAPLAGLLVSTAAFAEGDLTRNNPIEVVLEMGTTEDGEHMYFKPEHLEFETGKAYKLVLKNLDDQKHEFESHSMVERIFTRKVEIENDDGLVAEIKGNIREIEVGPHQQVDWYFVPLQPGDLLESTCAIEGHVEAGMHGTLTIR